MKLGFFLLLAAALATTACGRPPSGPGRVYLASGLTDQVFVFDAGDGSVLDTVPVDPRPAEVDEPHGVAASPDGRYWYATTLHGRPTVSKFDARDDHRLGMLRLDTPGAARIRLTPDGGRALVPDWWRSGEGKPSGLAVVELGNLKVLSTPTLCAAPHDAPVDPTGRRALVTCSYGDHVLFLDAGRPDSVLVRAPVGPDPGSPGSPKYGPLNGAWSPSGDTAWVTLERSREVVAMDTTGMILARDTLPGVPMQIAATPDGRHLVVPLRDAGALAILDTRPLRILRLVPLEGATSPHGVALNGSGTRAFVGYEGAVKGEGGVVAVEVPDGRTAWRRQAGRYDMGVAWGAGVR